MALPLRHPIRVHAPRNKRAQGGAGLRPPNAELLRHHQTYTLPRRPGQTAVAGGPPPSSQPRLSLRPPPAPVNAIRMPHPRRHRRSAERRPPQDKDTPLHPRPPESPIRTPPPEPPVQATRLWPPPQPPTLAASPLIRSTDRPTPEMPASAAVRRLLRSASPFRRAPRSPTPLPLAVPPTSRAGSGGQGLIAPASARHLVHSHSPSPRDLRSPPLPRRLAQFLWAALWNIRVPLYPRSSLAKTQRLLKPPVNLQGEAAGRAAKKSSPEGLDGHAVFSSI